jgi:hypothetical protein
MTALAAFLCCFCCLVAPSTAAPTVHKAPTRLHAPPEGAYLVTLPGDFATMRYTPFSLDRAARLQSRLELALRSWERWTDRKVAITAFVLSREEWESSGYTVEYGVPVRVGRAAIAVPALGDDGTVALWSDVLGGMLPQVQGAPFRGSPQQASTMVLADIVVQLLAAEIVIDEVGLAGNEPWLRGLTTHVASLDFVRRKEGARLADLDAMYKLIIQRRGEKVMSSRDYQPDLNLEDWIYFQACFHFGAQTILSKEGKGALKKLRKLRKKDGEVLQAERLLRHYTQLNEWYHAFFSAVSFRS